MTAEKYSPKWLLGKLNESKTETRKLMYIIEFQNEISKQYEKNLQQTK
jgi:hypothetical protein